jgi:hypothetical protein
MLNLKELSERYKDVGLGYIKFGGKSFYEINSDTPLQLNSYGGTSGFILNHNNEVQLFEFVEDGCKHYLKGVQITEVEFYELVEYFNDDDLEDEFLRMEHGGTRKWWGKTLDNYYPHPWYPGKEIIAFEIVNNLPFSRKGKIIELSGDGGISLNETVGYSILNCLSNPEFFKPIYK